MKKPVCNCGATERGKPKPLPEHKPWCALRPQPKVPRSARNQVDSLVSAAETYSYHMSEGTATQAGKSESELAETRFALLKHIERLSEPKMSQHARDLVDMAATHFVANYIERLTQPLTKKQIASIKLGSQSQYRNSSHQVARSTVAYHYLSGAIAALLALGYEIPAEITEAAGIIPKKHKP